ncbi:MAG: glycosyltransferase family 4 protein [Pseudomonadales bacterium]
MGGAQYQAKLLVDDLVATGNYDVHYVAKLIDEAFVPQGYQIHGIGRTGSMRYVLDSRRLLRVLQEIRPDTIYHQVGCAYTGVAAYYCSRSSCKLVWHIASDVDVIRSRPKVYEAFKYLDKHMLEYGLRRADIIVAQTDDQAAMLRQHYGREVTAIVRNFHPEPKEPISKSSPVEVVWIANLKLVKQPEIFIQLARDLSGSDAHFTMIGGLQGSEAWKSQMLAEMAATPNLTYAGTLTQDEVNARLAHAHVLVNTSQYEGFSNTFIQAWMREVPVVSLNVNPDGSFDQGNLGYCAGGDYRSLVSQVSSLIECEQTRARIGKRASVHARQHFGYDNIRALIALL